MISFVGQHRRWSLALLSGAVLLGLTATLAFGQKQPEAENPPSVAWKYLRASPPGDYVGPERCSSCHNPEFTEFKKTAHGRISVPGKDYVTGCEVCHGPGKVHSDAEEASEGAEAKTAAAAKLIFGFHGKPEENAARCLACHNSGRDQDLFNRSEHKLNGVSCEQCHAAHLVERVRNRERVEPLAPQAHFFAAPTLTEENRWLHESLLKKRQPDLCFTCHKVIQAQFSLPTHHRVPEGLMKCTDCHNAHGTLSRPLLKKAGWEACIACHIEKRGPFVFEHAAVRVEGCVACHSPHGTIERNMLLRREGRFLCLQCHVDPFAVNVPHGRLGFQTRGECVRCHATIHGSNFNEFFLN